MSLLKQIILTIISFKSCFSSNNKKNLSGLNFSGTPNKWHRHTSLCHDNSHPKIQKYWTSVNKIPVGNET